MAKLDNAGIELLGFHGYRERLEELFRETFGNDMHLSPVTLQGQLIGILSITLAEIEELVTYVNNGLNLYRLNGAQVDDYATLFDLPRKGPQHSTLEASLTGDPHTLIPPNSLVRDHQGKTYTTTQQHELNTKGEATVTLTAIQPGPQLTLPGDLDVIATPIEGWKNVSNTKPSTLGRNAETIGEYINRYHATLLQHAQSNLEAIQAKVLSLPGVTHCTVWDNSNTTPRILQGLTIPARYLLVIVKGGKDDEIAQTIGEVKPAGLATGTNTQSDVVVSLPAKQGLEAIDIRFLRSKPVPLVLMVTTQLTSRFPSDGLTKLRENTLNYMRGKWNTGDPNQFNREGYNIGEPWNEHRITTPLNAVPGHQIKNIVVHRKENRTRPILPIDLDEQYTLALEDLFINVTP